MNKKAFTIVEMAFVLIIVGLITAMAVKGSSVVELAKLRKEMGKVQKFQVALAGYWTREGSMPGNPTDTRIAGQALADLGIASLTEQVNVYSNPLISPRPGWSLVYCTEPASGHYYALTTAEHAISACLETDNVSLYFICHYENMYDDKNMTSGHGRAPGTTVLPGDCDLSPNGFMDYRIKIF